MIFGMVLYGKTRDVQRAFGRWMKVYMGMRCKEVYSGCSAWAAVCACEEGAREMNVHQEASSFCKNVTKQRT